MWNSQWRIKSWGQGGAPSLSGNLLRSRGGGLGPDQGGGGACAPDARPLNPPLYDWLNSHLELNTFTAWKDGKDCRDSKIIGLTMKVMDSTVSLLDTSLSNGLILLSSSLSLLKQARWGPYLQSFLWGFKYYHKWVKHSTTDNTGPR